MKVWIVNQYALPPSASGGTRHYSLARALQARGVEVEIFCSTRNYLTGKPITDPGTRDCAGVSFTFIDAGRAPAVGRRAGRLAGMLGFARGFRRAVRRRIGDAQVILGSTPSPIGAWAASAEARRRRVPFVLEVRDLWPRTLLDVGRLPRWHPAVRLFGAMERELYRRADRIVTLLPLAERHIRTVFPDAAPITWIPNGVDLRLVPPAAEPRFETDGGFIVLYAGAHGPANALDAVLDAAGRLQRRRPGGFRFVLVGDGHDKPRLQARAEAERLDSVDFLDPVPKAEVYGLMAAADALIVNMNRGNLYRFGISFNKLYDYLAVGRPIVSGTDAANDPVAEADAGVTVPANDPDALATALERLSAAPSAERAAMGARGRAFVEAHHDIERLAAQFEDVLRAAAGRRP
ncbi:MAG TPA: glycosyltransferase family 4 protein [Gemmatimonadales bacterium]|nr:glycosyltransferase family 4 protein [Gemmatimonadales bacterium]